MERNLFSGIFRDPAGQFDAPDVIADGMGILAAKDEIIDNFTSRYESAIHDIQNLIAFHYRDASRNPYSMDNLIKILSLWHGKSIK